MPRRERIITALSTAVIAAEIAALEVPVSIVGDGEGGAAAGEAQAVPPEGRLEALPEVELEVLKVVDVPLGGRVAVGGGGALAGNGVVGETATGTLSERREGQRLPRILGTTTWSRFRIMWVLKAA